jgi:hypothetical protein
MVIGRRMDQHERSPQRPVIAPPRSRPRKLGAADQARVPTGECRRRRRNGRKGTGPPAGPRPGRPW